MLKRLLLVLGETRASLAARQYAFQLARTMGADIAGLAGTDLSFIDAPMLGGIGTSAFKAHLEEELEEQAQHARARLHEAFDRECKTHDTAGELLSFEGDAVENVKLAAETCDLIVTGHDSTFQGKAREELPDTLDTLLSATPRPIVICGEETPEGRDILIAYDGSLPAMRALQIFTLLGVGANRHIHLISIDTDREVANRRISRAARYLQSHGHRVEMTPITTAASPVEAIRVEVAARRIETLVMGAYGHRTLRELIFGSTTRGLVEDPPCALFVYH